MSFASERKEIGEIVQYFMLTTWKTVSIRGGIDGGCAAMSDRHTRDLWKGSEGPRRGLRANQDLGQPGGRALLYMYM